MPHLHLTRELWRAVSQGRHDPSALPLRALSHLMELCPTCKEELDAFEREAEDEGYAYTYPVSIERSAEWAREKAEEISAEREEAQFQLTELLALPARERLVAIERAPQQFRGPALAELLIEASRAQMPGAPRESLALAELSAVLLMHTEWSPIVVELYARALAHMANALRVSGQLPEASRLFHAARFVLRYEAGGDRLVQAEMDHIEGAIRRAERRFSDAEILLLRATTAYQGEGLPRLAAQSLLTLGVMHQELRDGTRAAAAAQEALEMLNDEQEPRLCFIARHNLADGLCAEGQYAEASQLLAENQPLARRYGDSLSNLRVAWVEGKIARGLGQFEEAESHFLAARHGFLQQGIAYDAALVSLELALLYLEERRTAEVKHLAAEMVAVFEQQEVHREATVALMLFHDAAEMERVSAEQVRQLMTYLMQARRDPAYAFQAAS
jgi:tetratricopeptide (TPR) repeat protein